MRARVDALGAPGRLGLFAAALALLAAAAAALGSASGLEPESSRPAAMAMSGHAEAGPDESGLATSAGGYTFEPAQTSFSPGARKFGFRIAGPGGAAAHDFEREGGVQLHLIVVRRDLTGYRHLHPTLQPDGSWVARLPLGDPGTYRAFADFEVDGKKIVLGRDLFVGGALNPRPLPAASHTATAGAFAVTLSGAPLRAGVSSTLGFTVTRAGRPVERFEDYVGMRAHLVALREGDLAYTHLHALDARARSRIDFEAELDDPGRYRLFLQFKVAGRVETVPFTVEVTR